MIGNLEEYSECVRKGVECLFVDGKCSECGGCCSNLLPVTQKEINTIKVYCKNPRNPIAARKMHQSGAVLVDMWKEDFN